MYWHKWKFWQKISLVLLGIILVAIASGLMKLIEPVKVTPISQSSSPLEFSGQALLVASDADMVATAYADAQLNRVPGIEDTLTRISLPLDPQNPALATLPVSNSVMSWPQIITASPDGQRAYIVEARSRPDDDIQALETIDDIPEGQLLTVVDLANPAQPQIIESVNVGRNPEHISISPDGKFLAVNLKESGRELLIIELLADGKLGKKTYMPINDASDGKSGRVAVWHPSGRFLALTQDNERQVGFYSFKTDASGQPTVEPYGEPLEVGNHLGIGRFSADGRFFLVTDLRWSTRGIETFNFILNPPGEMIAIGFDEAGKQHQIVSRAEVGLSPEGFALSPDNSLIATVNLRRTYLSSFPPAWRGKPYSSLSLVKFEPNSGGLVTLSEYGFEGLLPEQATFDADGKSLAVVIYNYREPTPKTGAVEFWNVVSGNNPTLERTGFKLDLVRGAHDIILLP